MIRSVMRSIEDGCSETGGHGTVGEGYQGSSYIQLHNLLYLEVINDDNFVHLPIRL